MCIATNHLVCYSQYKFIISGTVTALPMGSSVSSATVIAAITTWIMRKIGRGLSSRAWKGIPMHFDQKLEKGMLAMKGGTTKAATANGQAV